MPTSQNIVVSTCLIGNEKMAGMKRKTTNANSNASASHGAESDSDETSVSTTSFLQNQNKEERLRIRTGYRQLMGTLVEQKHDMINPESTSLAEALKTANDLNKDVKMPREGALDSATILMISNYGWMKVDNLKTDFLKFEPNEYAEKLISFVNQRLQPRQSQNIAISNQGWINLGKYSQKKFMKSPAFHFMAGSFERGKPVKKVRRAPDSQRLDQENLSDRVTVPKQMKSFNESDKSEATIAEVEKLYDILLKVKKEEAMVHSGIGGRQVNSFLSALNIPPVSNTLLSQREKEMGSAMECVAQASVMKNLSEEVKLSKIVKSNAVKELREGDSYGSSVELMIHQDIKEIPSPRVPPKNVGIESASIPVYFDLETTGLSRNSHITQMAAVCGENQWQRFVKPKVPMSSKASDVTGITKRGSKMFHRGKSVHSSNLSFALESFVEFISRQGKCAILSGHNIKSYDCHVLFNALEAVGKMDTFKDHVAGFIDTKLLFRSQFPGLPSYSQQALVSSFLHCDYAAHDALQDVVFLRKLVRLVNFDEHYKLKASFSLPCATFSHESLRERAHNLPSLQGLVNEKIITINMGRKIAASDLNYAALKLAFSRGEEEGIQKVLSEECGSRPRVTKSSEIIHSIAEHFRKAIQNPEQEKVRKNLPHKQAVVSLSPQEWKELVEVFEIAEPKIPTRVRSTLDSSTTKKMRME
nr:uncharacterized protein LOC105337269 isoform X1 [Crassostrea gigas]